MIFDTFIFKGKRASSMGIELCDSLVLSEAIPRVETVSIPGRNGDLHYWDGSYKNRTITAECFLLDHAAVRNIDAINSWLISEPGYFRFEDSADPRHFMLARAVRGIPRDLKAGMLNSFGLEFDVMPERYLKSGNKYIEIWKGDGIGHVDDAVNPTVYPSFPLLKFTGLFAGKQYGANFYKSDEMIGKIRINTGEYNGTLFYDTKNDRAYSGGGEELNGLVTAEGDLRLFPRSGSGRVIVWVANYNGLLNVLPRWWEI